MREAASLYQAGYDVTLIAVDNHLRSLDTGVRVVRLKRRSRFFRMTLGSVVALFEALRTGARIVHLHDPELVWTIPIFRATRRVVIYDAHEDLPAQTLSKQYIPSWAMRFAVSVSRVLVRMAGAAHLVIAATEPIAELFNPRKVAVVRNYPRARPAESDTNPIGDRPPHLAYIGALSTERGTDVMTAALEHPRFPQGWKLVLAGPADPAYLQHLRGKSAWTAVDYEGVLSTEEARDLLATCRVGICALQRTPAYLESLPTKMFEYFAAGIPVIASDFPLWRDIVEQFDCGILIDETSPAALAEAVATYDADPELLTRHSRNAFGAAKAYTWSSEERILLQSYASLIDRKANRA